MQNKKCLKNKIFLPCHSSVKRSDPGDFLKAQFVIFKCQKYVKKRVHGNEKMNLPCAFKVSWVAPFYTTLLLLKKKKKKKKNQQLISTKKIY